MDTLNKVALVTGAGTGIGQHFALALLKQGWTVVLAGRRIEPLEQTALAAGVAPSLALVAPTDITDQVAVEALFAKIKSTFGRLDLLFNNAGVNAPGILLEELSLDDWKAVIDTNLTGAFLCTQQAFKMMKNQNPMGGRIINNGSVSAHTPRPNSAPYTCSKYAISGLTKCTSLDGRKYNIACGQIDIGNAATNMTERMKKGVPQADGTLAPEPIIDLSHVTEALLYMADLPLSANIQSLMVMATKMPFIGRG